jgi:hypothetical protein
MSLIARQRGFLVCAAGPVFNRYALRYLVRLLPMPGGLKRRLLRFFDHSILGRIRLLVPLGNLQLVARKPEREEPVAP